MELIPTLLKLYEKYVDELDITEQHFDVGDTAYVMDSRWPYFGPKPVIITEISDFRAKFQKWVDKGKG